MLVSCLTLVALFALAGLLGDGLGVGVLVAILFLGSLQLLSVGLLGEYIGRVYLETKQRPVYVVRREFGTGDGA